MHGHASIANGAQVLTARDQYDRDVGLPELCGEQRAERAGPDDDIARHDAAAVSSMSSSAREPARFCPGIAAMSSRVTGCCGCANTAAV